MPKETAASILSAPQGGTLTLDLARVTGWAYGPLVWGEPLFGDLYMPALGGEGIRYASLENELIHMLDVFKPGQIVMESALPPQAQTNVTSARQAYGMRAIVYCNAYREAVSVSEVSADLVRNELLGFSRAPGRPDAIKTHVVHFCKRRGWHVPSHNAGDACLLWEWFRRRLVGPRQGALVPVY
jgi:hypothetical protein